MLGNQRIKAAEQHSARGPFRIQLRRNRPAVERHSRAGQFDTVGQQRVRKRGGFFDRTICRRNLKAIQVKHPQIGAHPFFVAPIWHRQRFELFPSRAPLLDQPIRLTARLEKRLERGGRKSGHYGGRWHLLNLSADNTS